VRVELHPDARAELRSAALWFEERRVGLGGASPPIRKATPHRFPYLIAFERQEQHVLVLAVAHAKRQPLWLWRANP
jgi:hypothetical protein